MGFAPFKGLWPSNRTKSQAILPQNDCQCKSCDKPLISNGFIIFINKIKGIDLIRLIHKERIRLLNKKAGKKSASLLTEKLIFYVILIFMHKRKKYLL